MALRLLFESEYVTIFYDYSNEWLYVDWQKEQNQASVQTGCERMLECLRQEQCHKVLNDNRQVDSMWSDASEWVGKVWLPAMAEVGLQYFAWVYSPNLYSRLSTDLTLQHAPAVGPIAFTFDSIDTASAWLKQM
ncbi:hypothetical protein H8B13_04860 [Hymenobacter sp. BT188]|uniref:hypothetical protein n=1 Tax=Hymenobacter sp. BT188 TaxID=2763504 RepID=UPI0016516358|nr:hypothetical protein [Hymenobacter sp. BT188]MBC6606142.1 hypothetical protein [Hymenobacter sp. BT188]